jgi:serine/threonine protein phosphatase PrpC
VDGDVYQVDHLAEEAYADQLLLIGIADDVVATPRAAKMSVALLQAVAAAYRQGRLHFNAKLIRRAQETPSKQGLPRQSASTVVLAEIRDRCVTVLNTGDSRACLIDKVTGAHRRLSKDHTTFELLKEQGELPENAQDCDCGNLATGLLEAVTAAPTADQDFAVHMGYARLGDDDVVLLCSDWVTAHLRDAGIADEMVTASGLGQDLGKRIIDLVRDHGMSDNTTLIVVQ